uniref:Guanine nucleotide-binding protein subunit beta-like protein n=1 Tax=Percolomonas cosmopolitus TaxID=63605 RepID=A0A7S1PG97_9EUKA
MSKTYFKNIHNPLAELQTLTSLSSPIHQQDNIFDVSSNADDVFERKDLESAGSGQQQQTAAASTLIGEESTTSAQTAHSQQQQGNGGGDNSSQPSTTAAASTNVELIETEFLINQMVEDLNQNDFKKLKDKMTEYDDVDGMKPVDFIALWNSLIEKRHPEKLHDDIYQQRIVDMFRQIDFDQDGRLTFDEFSGNLVACQRQSATQFATYDETPVVVSNPHIIPDKLIYAPHYNKIISCGKPEHSALWSVRDGSLYKMLDGHHASLHSALYIEQRELLMTCSADRTMIAFDSRTLKKKRQIPTKIAQLCMVYDQNTKKLYTGGTDSNIHIWNLDDFSENRTTFKSQNAHTDFVMDLCMLEDLNLLISCSLDKTIKLWDTRSLKCKHTKVGHLKGVTGLTYSKKYKLLVSFGCEKYAYMWNTLSTSCVFRFEGHSRPLIGAHIVEDTPELITVDTSGIVIIWNIRTYRAMQKLRPPNVDFARFRTFCYDTHTKQIITSGEHEMNYWKSIQAETKMGGITHAVVQIRYNRVFKQLLTGVKRFLTVWKSHNGDLHKQYPVSDSNITDFIILGQWRTAAVATVDGEIKMVSLMDGTVNRSVSLKDEIRGLFLVENELNDEDKGHLLIPTLKGDLYRVDLMKEQIVSVHKSALKNCTISGSVYSEKYKLLATISGDVIEVWKPFNPDHEHRQVETGDDTSACLFVDLWDCFVTIDMSGNLKIFSVPSFRHLLTVRFELPIPYIKNNNQSTHDMQNPTPLSLINAHEKQGCLIVSSAYHVSVLNVQWLAVQCQAEIDKKSITSKGQTTMYRDCIIALTNSSRLEDTDKVNHAFDTKSMRLCNVQFFSTSENCEKIKNLLDTVQVLKTSKFISHHYDIFEPEGEAKSARSGHSEDDIHRWGCVLTEHSTVTLEKYLKHQDLRIDETRWLTVCIVNAIKEVHDCGFVINNLCAKNIVRVDRTWKLINLHHCVKEGKSFLASDLATCLYSPEYAAQIQEGASSIVATRTHDIWSFATLLLRLTTKHIFVDETMIKATIFDKLVEGPQKTPVFSITFEDVIDVTPRNILRHVFLRNPSSRWTIFQIIKHMETSGALSQESPPVQERLMTDTGDDSDTDDDEDNDDEAIHFPQLWDNQAYNPFMVFHHNPRVLMSNITICTASEGKITATCIADDPPLIITSYFNKVYQQGWVYLYDFMGTLLGTIPHEQEELTWEWPDVHTASKIYYEFEIPDTDDLGVTPLGGNDSMDGETPVNSASRIDPDTPGAIQKKRNPRRAVWQEDSDSEDDDALKEILGTHQEKEAETKHSNERDDLVRSKLNIKPKIKVTFRGRRKQA